MANYNAQARNDLKSKEKKQYLCSVKFVGVDGMEYRCVFRYGTVKKVFGHVYAPVKVEHVHISSSGVKEGKFRQVEL